MVLMSLLVTDVFWSWVFSWFNLGRPYAFGLALLDLPYRYLGCPGPALPWPYPCSGPSLAQVLALPLPWTFPQSVLTLPWLWPRPLS